MAWLPAKTGREARLFVAVGERGILVLPHLLADEPAPMLIDAGGSVADVAAFRDKLFALIRGERPRVVRLDEREGSFVPEVSFDLPGVARRFVRRSATEECEDYRGRAKLILEVAHMAR